MIAEKTRTNNTNHGKYGTLVYISAAAPKNRYLRHETKKKVCSEIVYQLSLM